jgi:hypothetical protein
LPSLSPWLSLLAPHISFCAFEEILVFLVNFRMKSEKYDCHLPTSVEGGEQDAVSGTTTTTNNNVSNALLGRLFMSVGFETTNVNPINETYIETSTVNNVTIVPPNATTATTAINGTETANVRVDILPNGLVLDKGQSLIVTQGDEGTAAVQENATTTFVTLVL